MEQYMTTNSCLDEEVLQKIWLTQTAIFSRLLEAHMAQSKIKRVIRLDHSRSFAANSKSTGLKVRRISRARYVCYC
ncbi:hypothetical protein GQ600_25998 [Phytophthora cactorum]|nr:hypothetical protein GQ600_25998 [Phytophthora cactorum]